jgi:hypothetical protein
MIRRVLLVLVLLWPAVAGADAWPWPNSLGLRPEGFAPWYWIPISRTPGTAIVGAPLHGVVCSRGHSRSSQPSASDSTSTAPRWARRAIVASISGQGQGSSAGRPAAPAPRVFRLLLRAGMRRGFHRQSKINRPDDPDVGDHRKNRRAFAHGARRNRLTRRSRTLRWDDDRMRGIFRGPNGMGYFGRIVDGLCRNAATRAHARRAVGASGAGPRPKSPPPGFPPPEVSSQVIRP